MCRSDEVACVGALAWAMQSPNFMADLLFIAAIAVFFTCSWGYVRACERLG
jgi:hypothetical protein